MYVYICRDVDGSRFSGTYNIHSFEKASYGKTEIIDLI